MNPSPFWSHERALLERAIMHTEASRGEQFSFPLSLSKDT